MENAILYAGIDELNTIKEHVLEFNGYQEQNETLKSEETRLIKLLDSKERALNEEIETTLKKRKSDLTETYESQLLALNARAKKIKAKKEKDKGTKVSARMEEETAELRDKNKALTLEIKAKLKTDKTPAICNTTLFYGLFMPKMFSEFVIFMLGLLLAFFALPFGIYRLFFAEKFGELALALIYVITILVIGSLYMLINNKLKEKHLETIRAVRVLRNQHHRNRKNIRDIKKGIRNDSDESSYGLEQYDDELQEISNETKHVTEQEKEALTAFETVTSAQIKEEIRGRYENELAALKETYQTTCAEQKQTEDKVKEIALMLSTNYEAYLGKDMLTVPKLDRLIAHIKSGEATDIGTALAIEKNK